MSHSFKIIVFLFLLTACQVEGNLTSNHALGTSLSGQARLVYTADFTTTDGISGSGSLEIYADQKKYKLKLVNYSIEDGPDLKVYLSQSNTPNAFVNLGNLARQQIYILPENINFSEYNHVLIHCQQYNHLFAYGTLIPQM